MHTFLILVLFWFPKFDAHARDAWQICFDDGNFTLNLNEVFRSSKLVKDGCHMRMVDGNAKGIRFELDLCDPAIRIDRYEGIDAKAPQRLYAGSTGCEFALFGADFGPASGTGPRFVESRNQIETLLSALERVYGAPKGAKVDVAKVKLANDEGAKMACARILLEDYLRKCMAMPGKP